MPPASDGTSRGFTVGIGLALREVRVRQWLRILGKALRPSEAELQDNPRARSAVLRVAEVLG